MATVAALSDELESLKKNFPKIQITSATCHFVTFTYERTIYARVKATLTFPEDYPAHALHVSISLVPPGLAKKLERELDNVAQEHLSLPSSRPTQVEAVVRCLLNFMDTNKFVPCWKELKQVVELVKQVAAKEETLSSTTISSRIIALQETKGLIQLRWTRNKYYYACSITVDDNYPSTTTHETWGNACKLVMRETNLPPQIARTLTLQAKELVRHMQDGMSYEKALHYSNPIQAPKDKDKNDEQLSGGNARNVKPHKSNTNHKRKEQNVIACQIAPTKWQEEDQGRLLESYPMEVDYADHNPQPSLLSLVTFLHSKIQLLPDEKCPICKEFTLPSNPEGRNEERNGKNRKPIRTHCGCWYHYSCLDKFMVEPPFGAACPTLHCGKNKRVYHPNWPADRNELERNWASKQARQREIDDAAMFF